jgi:PAS domain S-box-containing protein
MNQVIYYFTHLLSTEGLPPRWSCGLWPPFQGWFYITADLGIWAAYFTIPLLLLKFTRKRPDLPFPKIFWLFAAFIFACGTTHLMDALMFWWPAYRLSGLVYFATAVISWWTIIALVPIIPQALALKSPAVLEEEIQERKVIEEQLSQTNEALLFNEERFRLLIATVKDYAIYRIDPDGIIQTWNEGAKRLKGYQAEEIIGQHFSKFYPPEAIEQGYPDYELKIAAKQGHFEDEGWRVRKDGSRFWANVILTALYDEDGNLNGFTKITRDLTERKIAQEELQSSEQRYRELAETLKYQSTQLEAVNKELEAFCYSISHDLRAPLRAIDGFSQAIYEEYADKLDDTGKRYLTRVRDGSQQMAGLIDDMLNLSRLTRGELNFEDNIDLSQIAKSITADLQRMEPDRQVAFSIEEDLVVCGDKRLLQSMLWNLLGNAWKYTSKHTSANIEFGKITNGKTIYYVKDDGAGFNMQYADKLFGAFQRLHKSSEFAGTGVGLATVARIIHRHGGQIWAEGEVEKGATFYFTLEPVKVEKEDANGRQQDYSVS